MKINSVLEQVSRFYPSEFNAGEMYNFCNEVSAMLVVEDRFCLREAVLGLAADRSIILPDGLIYENVRHIYAGTRELDKSVLRTGAPEFIDMPYTSVRIIYEAPYEPIRLVKYNGSIMFYTTKDEIRISSCRFIPGDTVLLTYNGADYELTVTSISPTSTVGYYVRVNSLSSIGGITDRMSADNITMQRVVTDDTVCDAPFDTMYVDYCLAKINLYQDNINKYNTFLSSFNSKLQAYKKWLVGRTYTENDTFTNWWPGKGE